MTDIEEHADYLKVVQFDGAVMSSEADKAEIHTNRRPSSR